MWDSSEAFAVLALNVKPGGIEVAGCESFSSKRDSPGNRNIGAVKTSRQSADIQKVFPMTYYSLSVAFAVILDISLLKDVRPPVMPIPPSFTIYSFPPGYSQPIFTPLGDSILLIIVYSEYIQLKY